MFAPFVDPRSIPSAVIKVGGSLLDLADLPERLSRMRPAWGDRPLLVIGGGAVADVVRYWDQIHRLGEQRSHDLAVRSLLLSAALVEALWADALSVPWTGFTTAWHASRVPLVNVRDAFSEAESHQWPTPPEEWSATTDTIAAWIAGISGASELWLLKSIPAPESLAVAAGQGLVDPQFPTWCREKNLDVYWVNGREDVTNRPFSVSRLSEDRGPQAPRS